MEDADLFGIGQHCCVAACQQLDFLPFTCDACGKIYCLDHRTYQGHKCPAAGSRVTEVIVCPLCAKGVRLRAGQDANAAFNEHAASSGCDPANYARVHKKPRCPAENCKEKLTTINTYSCKSCGQRVCLKHRHADDHGCKAAQERARDQRGLLARIRAPFNGSSTSSLPATAPARGGASTRSPLPTTAPSKDGTSSFGIAASTRQPQHAAPSSSAATTSKPSFPAGQPRQRVQPQQWSAATSNANPLVPPPPLPEVCPQCNARFATVERLVQHVEEWHPSGASSAASRPASRAPPATGGITGFLGGAPGTVARPVIDLTSSPSPASQQAPAGDVFRCHTCGKQYTDAVALVAHAERCGTTVSAGARASLGAGAAQGSGADGCTLQ